MRWTRCVWEFPLKAFSEIFQSRARSSGARLRRLDLNLTTDGTVDEETQRNDLAVIRQVTSTTEPMAITQGYDFTMARAADRELTQSGWRP